MFSKRKKKDAGRFYLLPGQGGSNLRRRQRQLISIAILTSVLMAGIMAWVMWYFTRLNR